MAAWHEFVELFRVAIVAYSHAFGGNLALGIMTVTLLLRLAMLPLTLKLARLSAAHQDAMRRLKPQLDAIRKRHRSRPERAAEETRCLFEREGVSPLPLAGCAGALAQAPIFFGMFSAVRACAAAGGRFLWIRNLAGPDLVLALCVTAMTGVAVALGMKPGDQNRALLIAIPTLVTLLIITRMAAGIALYWGVSSLVSIVQGAIVRRERGRAGGAA